MLAGLSLAALTQFRLGFEPVGNIIFEGFLQSLALLGLALTGARLEKVTKSLLFVAWLVIAPWLGHYLLRLFATGSSFEILMMASLGWGALGVTWRITTRRALGISVVCSGFLVLFITCSSEQSVAIIYAYVWGILCLWWLVTNHWEQVRGCQASVHVESLWYRPLTVIAGGCVFALAVWLMAGRSPATKRLSWQLMPTSGGTGAYDASARSGVGDGDAVVAAQQQAASFGAVESEIFLDSDEPSLFDVYNETFGEPAKKMRYERSVALSPMNEMEDKGKLAESKSGSARFTVHRTAPPPSKPLRSVASDSILRWVGRSNQHLAVERFDHFDGSDWSVGEPSDTKPTALPINGRSVGDKDWFSVFDQNSLTTELFVGGLAEAIKFTGFQSPIIPTTNGYHSWHVAQVNAPDFFAVDRFGTLSMPGRKRVPDFTIVNFANREIDLQALVNRFHIQPADAQKPPPSEISRIDEAVMQWTQGKATGWDQISAVIDRLRSDFQYDRTQDYSDVDQPIQAFLESRRGNDILFATTAAVMLKQLGYQTRFVTGFVAHSKHRIGMSQEIAIYPSDAHAWIEIHAGQDEWVPLEPTPTFPLPQYHRTWRYRLRESAGTISASLLGLATLAGAFWWQRILAFDFLCWLAQGLLWFANDRQRSRWLLWILDWRCRLVGIRRPPHMVPKLWINRLIQGSNDTQWNQTINTFFSEADRMYFGSTGELSQAGREACFRIWRDFTGRQLNKLRIVAFRSAKVAQT